MRVALVPRLSAAALLIPTDSVREARHGLIEVYEQNHGDDVREVINDGQVFQHTANKGDIPDKGQD